MPNGSAARSRWPPLALFSWGVLFLVAALFNGGGYRYGASDQAFYVPAVLHHLDPALFPRDWSLLASQDRFSAFPAAAAGLVRLTGLGIPEIFFALYLLGLVLLFLAAIGIGSRLYRSHWTVAALAFAMSLRHAVALGAVNTLEGYMHPRMIAFALGALAIASCLARRPARAALLVALAAMCHPTTALWFGIWVAVAFAVSDKRFTRPVLGAALLSVLLGAWALTAGPLAGRLVRMDADWLTVLQPKKYLFPTEWSFTGWLPAVLVPFAAAWLHRRRHRLGLVSEPERGVAAGAAVLFLLFLASIPFTAARVAFAVQLQVPRVLWMVDLLAVAYLVWYLAEGARWASARSPDADVASRSRAARATALVFLAVALTRGAYVTFVQHPERPPLRIGLPRGEWTDAMEWIRTRTAKDAWVLADPGHAWKYGTSVRVAAWRDVYLEEAKDAAVAMYSREGALVVRDRIRRAAGFDRLTAEEARALAAAGGPNLLVTEMEMDLPLLHAGGRFKIYNLR